MRVVEFIQAHPSNYTRGRGGRTIDGMGVHYTATSASEHSNLVYFSRADAQASAHLFVDRDGAIRQSVRLEDTAWAVGNFAENQRTVSVEVVSAGEDFTDAQVAALAEIYAYLRATYGITRVIRHYDVTGKRCPAPYINASKWAAFKARITGGATSGGTSGGAVCSQGVSAGYTAKITTDALNIREGPGTDHGIAGCIRNRGVYTIVAESSGRGASLWGKLKSGAGWISLNYASRLSGGTASGGKSVEELARECIRGDWGNGSERAAAGLPAAVPAAGLVGWKAGSVGPCPVHGFSTLSTRPEPCCIAEGVWEGLESPEAPSIFNPDGPAARF